ncbi:MAG TPA: arginase family protein [Mycobacteriales bacterium]|nr:arginase family protein [Mycobacteriales bacterium]
MRRRLYMGHSRDSIANVNRSSADHRWPSAGEWLAGGPGARDVDLAVIGIPTFATSVPPSGAHATPAAVRRALGRLSTWSASRGVDLAERVAPWDRGDVDDPDVPVEGEWRIRTAVETAAAKSRLLVVLGGDNSLTYPAMSGVFGDQLGRAGLVTVDAHHDLREGRGNGSPVRELITAGVPGEQIVQVGIADWANSRSYAVEAHARGVTVIGRGQVGERGAADCMREALDLAGSGAAGVYVDLDLDACDRAVAPACPASLPGGLSARDLLTAAYVAGADPRVRAIDITEVDATRDADDERTVRLAAMCLLEIAAGLAPRSDQ